MGPEDGKLSSGLPARKEFCSLETILTLDHFSKVYRNGRGAKNITFSVERGEVVGLLGPNGSGKTTIMKAITMTTIAMTITARAVPAAVTIMIITTMPMKYLQVGEGKLLMCSPEK